MPAPLESELARRLRQQEIVADFALLALHATARERMCEAACRSAASGLDAHYAKVLQYRPDSDDFLYYAAVGWDAKLVGSARIGSGARSPSGHAFRNRAPVVCADGAVSPEDIAFRLPRQLREHGIRSAIVVPIHEAGGAEPFGVLEVDSVATDAFTRHDVAFLRALANILGAALDALTRAQSLRRSEAFAASVLDACPDCVEVLDAAGIVARINSHGLALLGIDLPALRVGLRWIEQWNSEDQPRAAHALARARQGATGRFAAYNPGRRGVPQWWDVLIAPMPDGDFVAVSRDATAQMLATGAKDSALRDKELMMLEVHHRVKNSLQLVQNLLSMQARAALDDDSASALGESAARVRTIAAIHERLYRAGTTLEVEIGPYLDGLIEDLQAALVGPDAERRIVLQSDAAIWPASEVPTLGLVLTELVTNALKYGAGDVTVSFRQPPGERARLVVEDEGSGPEADFDPARSRGLGMRLVTGLLRGDGAGLEIDHASGHARFIARLPLRHIAKSEI